MPNLCWKKMPNLCWKLMAGLVLALAWVPEANGSEETEIIPVKVQSKDCQSRTFLSDILLEDCVRKELDQSLKDDVITRGYISQLSQYTEVWAKCADIIMHSRCKMSNRDSARTRKLIRLHILKLWSHMDKLIDSWETIKNGSSVSPECRQSLLTYAGRNCLPIIAAYTAGYGDMRTTKHFVECVKGEIQSCSKESQAYFISIIFKNLKFRMTLSEYDNMLIKECIEVINKTKMELCSPGFYDILDSLAFEKVISTKIVKIPFERNCIYDEMHLCRPEAFDAISNVSKIFLNASFEDLTTILHRSLSQKTFVLMPEDRLEIGKCLSRTRRQDIDDCLPGLYRSLSYIVEGRPLKTSVLRIEMKGTGCLGTAFKECSGSMRFIIHKVYYGLYKTKLDIPFDKNSLLSPPGQYEKIFMEILYPPYNISGEVLNELAKCVHSMMDTFELCCGEFSDALFKVLSNKPLPFPLSVKSECTESCYKGNMSLCSESGRMYTERLIYSVKLAYMKFEEFGMFHLPPSPPYNIPDRIFEKIEDCMDVADTDTLEKLCPGIFEVLTAFKKNETLPSKRISPRTCTYENLIQATTTCNETSAIYLRMFVNFLFRMYEESPSSMELFYFRKTDSPSLDILSYSKSEEMMISKCLREHEMQMETCCPSLFSVIAVAVLNVPMRVDENQLRWCSKFCYEPFVFLCDNPLMMLHLINTVIKIKKPIDYNFDHIVPFPSDPPYNLPESVTGPIRLCFNMMKEELSECCPQMAVAMENVLNNQPWSRQEACMGFCPFTCYKKSVSKCHPEGRDLAAGMIISIAHCREVYAALKDCFTISYASFKDCCPDVAESISAIYSGKHWMLNATVIGDCNVQRLMRSMDKCSRQDIDIIQKVTKYVIDYSYKDYSFLENYGFRFTSKDLKIIDKCFDSMHPFLEECCPAMKGAVYTILNSEKWPVDGPNLKRCHHYCLESAMNVCSPDAIKVVSALFKYATSIPATGIRKFGEECIVIIKEALGCCDTMVKAVYEYKFVNQNTSFATRRCRSVCKEKLISDCFNFSGERGYLSSLLKFHFVPSNAKVSKSAMKDAHLLPVVPYHDAFGGIPHGDLMELEHRSQSGKLSFGETVDLPPLIKEKTKACLYMVRKEEIDECWTGFYDFLLYLCNRIKYIPKLTKPPKRTCHCLKRALSVCPVDSILVINALANNHLNTNFELVDNTNEELPKEVIDEEAKRAVYKCLNEADKDALDNCYSEFGDILKEILETGKSTKMITFREDVQDCLKEVFGICTMQSRLEIIKIFYQHRGIVLKIPVAVQSTNFNIMKLVTESERTLIHECLRTTDKDVMDECLPGLYQILAGISTVPMDLHFEPKGKSKCLSLIFSHCSTHTKIIISDLMKLATGSTVEIPNPKAAYYEPISDEEREFLMPCLAVLDQERIRDCIPELFDILYHISENRIPDTKKYSVKVYSTKCVEKTFKRCSAEARLVLTELISKYTNGYASFLFSVSEDHRIDENMLVILKECYSTVPDSLIEHCISGLNKALKYMLAGRIPNTNVHFKMEKNAEPACPKEMFSSCSVYHRLLIDELLRKIPHTYHDTTMFEIFYPMRLDSGSHTHPSSDMAVVGRCISAVNVQSLENCVPGLYGMLLALLNSSTSINYFATKQINRWCLSMNFANCSYSARVLIKDLMYDFYRLTIDIPLERSPEGPTGLLGPPIDDIQACLSNVDSKAADICFPGILNSLIQKYVEKNETLIPKLPSGREENVLSCLTDVMKCDVDILMFVLEKTARLNGIDFTVQIKEPPEGEIIPNNLGISFRALEPKNN